MDDIPVYPGSIHGLSMWQYPNHESTFGPVHSRRRLVECPYESRIPRRFRIGTCATVRELTAVNFFYKSIIFIRTNSCILIFF